MSFQAYRIFTALLRPYMQYVLFNYAADGSRFHFEICYYANYSISLGVVKRKELVNLDGNHLIADIN